MRLSGQNMALYFQNKPLYYQDMTLINVAYVILISGYYIIIIVLSLQCQTNYYNNFITFHIDMSENICDAIISPYDNIIML